MDKAAFLLEYRPPYYGPLYPPECEQQRFLLCTWCTLECCDPDYDRPDDGRPLPKRTLRLRDGERLALQKAMKNAPRSELPLPKEERGPIGDPHGDYGRHLAAFKAVHNAYRLMPFAKLTAAEEKKNEEQNRKRSKARRDLQAAAAASKAKAAKRTAAADGQAAATAPEAEPAAASAAHLADVPLPLITVWDTEFDLPRELQRREPVKSAAATAPAAKKAKASTAKASARSATRTGRRAVVDPLASDDEEENVPHFDGEVGDAEALLDDEEPGDDDEEEDEEEDEEGGGRRRKKKGKAGDEDEEQDEDDEDVAAAEEDFDDDAGDYNANAHIAYEDDDTYMEDEGGGGGEQME